LSLARSACAFADEDELGALLGLLELVGMHQRIIEHDVRLA
jgi:hypothetical protein